MSFELYDPDYDKKWCRLKWNHLVKRIGITDIESASDMEWREREQWTHVLTVLEIKPDHKYDKWIQMEDKEDAQIMKSFDDAADWIHQQLTSSLKSNVLVHCFAGISRSPTIVAAYLIKYHQYSAQKAMDLIRCYRPIVDPNRGFLSQLCTYADTQASIYVDLSRRDNRYVWETVCRQDLCVLLCLVAYM
jgi:protein-tyrosine phosphatase